MHIVQIAPPWINIPPIGYGGSELIVGLLCQGLKKLGHDVHLFCRETNLDVSADRIPDPDSPVPDKYSENRFLSFCTARMLEAKVDVVHSHLETFAGFQRTCQRTWPTIITIHIPVTEPLARYLSHFPEVVLVTPGAIHAKRLTEYRKDVWCIPHGIDVERYEYREEKDGYLCFLGRIMASKGVAEVLKLARLADLPLVIAGPVMSADRFFFNREIKPFIDGKAVRYLGEVGFAEKNAILSRAVALVHPVKVDEAFGLTLAEAMACGTPALAYSRGAVVEMVTDGVTGVVVDSFDEMVARLGEVFNIRPANCRARVKEKFPLQTMIDSYLKLYQECLRVCA